MEPSKETKWAGGPTIQEGVLVMKRKLAVLGTVLAAVAVGSVLTLPAGADHGPGYQQVASAGLQFQPGTMATVPGVPIATVCDAGGCRSIRTDPQSVPTTISSLRVNWEYILAKTSAHLPSVTELAGQIRCTDGTYAPGVQVGAAVGSGESFRSFKVEVLLNGAKIHESQPDIKDDGTDTKVKDTPVVPLTTVLLGNGCGAAQVASPQ